MPESPGCGKTTGMNILRILMVLAVLGWCQPTAVGSPRPNIVWLVGENIDLDLGCYGAARVSTP